MAVYILLGIPTLFYAYYKVKGVDAEKQCCLRSNCWNRKPVLAWTHACMSRFSARRFYLWGPTCLLVYDHCSAHVPLFAAYVAYATSLALQMKKFLIKFHGIFSLTVTGKLSIALKKTDMCKKLVVSPFCNTNNTRP